MNTRKLTESAVLSALLVMTGIIFISSFIGYQVYLDFILPIFISLIFLRCDFKYTLLSAFTSVTLISFVFGNPAYSLWMIQNMTIGFICGYLIKKDTNLMDDLFYCSLFAALVLVFVDVFLSGIIGYSFMKETQDAMIYFEEYSIATEVLFYLLLAALPLGTVIMTYLGGLIIGKRLNILNENGIRKFIYIKKYKKYGSMQFCSEKTIYIGIIYFILISVIGDNNILFKYTYSKTVLTTMKYITLYFVIKDSYSLICNFVYKIFSKIIIVVALQIVMLYSLINFFKVTAFALIIGGIAIDKQFNIRNNTEKYLKRINLKSEIC